MNNSNNYELAKVAARELFLALDHKQIIEKYALLHDGKYLYLTMLGIGYRIERSTAAVSRRENDGWADANFNEALTIYDLLRPDLQKPVLSGIWCKVNSLPGITQTSGLGNNWLDRYGELFSKDEATFLSACSKLGGTAVPFGDYGFIFTVFQPLDVLLRIYRADEEFPAQVTLLWDKNTLEFMHYETTYYAADILFRNIQRMLD